MLLRRRAPSYGAARALCRWMAAQGRRRLLPGQVQVRRGLRRLGSQWGVCSAARIVAEKRSGSRRAARSSNGIEFGAAWRVGGASAMVSSRPKRRAPICNASKSALSDACVSWHPDERPLNSFPCPGEAKGTNQCAWRRLRGLLFCMAAPARELPPLKTKYCGCWHDRCWHTPPLVDAVPTLLCW